MRLVTNAKLIKRNSYIGNYAGLAALGVLLLSLAIPFVTRDPSFQFLQLIALLGGIMLLNVGTYFRNRWVGPPRPDEALDAALKGLDERHVLYHYRLPASHVLAAPSGVYALVTKWHSGAITYKDGKWKHPGHTWLMSLVGQEPLGNPVAEAGAEIDALSKFLEKRLAEFAVPVQGIVVFTNNRATVAADSPPLPILHAKQLKEYIRRQPKGPSLSREALAQLNALLKVETRSDAASANSS
ncbi:MAG: NERD domain-containing protein [Chloroflexi bacterium]|nr:NERD domain-containing protein [Chloroflexota bacterium]